MENRQFVWIFCISNFFLISVVKSSTLLEAFGNCMYAKGTSEDQIILRDDPESSTAYKNLNYQWQTRKTVNPLGFVVAEKVRDVKNAVICGRIVGIHVVPKGGGHSFEKHGFASGDNATSLVLDLQNLNQIRMNSAKRTASVGAGALVAHIHWAIWHSGKFSIPTGLCPSVGIAGLALCGGYGYLSKAYGLTLDSIVEMEMVDADGILWKVNAKSRPDLFWALRGAGCSGSFGVVTKFKFKLHDAGNWKFFFTKVDFDPKGFDEVFSAWQSVSASRSIRPQSTTVRLYYGRKNMQLIIFDFDKGGSEENEKFISGLLGKFPTESRRGPAKTVILNYPQLLEETSASFVHGIKIKWLDFPLVSRRTAHKESEKAKSFYVNKILESSDITKLTKIMNTLPEGVALGFLPQGGATQNVSTRATAYVHRKTFYDVLAETHNANEEENMVWLSKFIPQCKFMDSGRTYANYDDDDLDNCLERYYGSNLPKLMKIKKFVDPTNFFRQGQSIPLPKLPVG